MKSVLKYGKRICSDTMICKERDGVILLCSTKSVPTGGEIDTLMLKSKVSPPETYLL